jgi:hypothetical protein
MHLFIIEKIIVEWEDLPEDYGCYSTMHQRTLIVKKILLFFMSL